jgi:endogenous inhibitor of DNA gyrase (YacG/DUF329 family)
MADPARPRPCPICGKPATPRERPFCSARCAEIDLGRWFGETYRIPGPPGDPDDDMTG